MGSIYRIICLSVIAREDQLLALILLMTAWRRCLGYEFGDGEGGAYGRGREGRDA